MQDSEDDLTGTGNINEIPIFVEERDLNPLGKNSFTGEMIVCYCIGLEQF